MYRAHPDAASFPDTDSLNTHGHSLRGPHPPHRTQQMTYVKQLEAYEEAVMRKRVDEMTEDELNDLVREAGKK